MSNPFFEKPILNSPYAYPVRHWELDDDGQPTQKIKETRRRAEFITPIPKPKKRKASAEQTSLLFDEGKGLSTQEQRYDHTAIINSVRQEVDKWRALPNTNDWRVTPETARLLQHWRHHQFSNIQYDGVDIERLSQGTRGIVLLLLYLAIDEEDDRPLVIDQPEESLDPQSIFDELVTRFRSAKKRRQIIIVTHNANLVVNTDADQVIVATVGRHRPGELPQIQYESGGLENPEIRKRVCDILEGGERAFKARAKRLRLGINEVSVQQVAVTTLA